MTIPTLAPCPFCGSIDDDLSCDVDEYGRASVTCQNCASEGPFVVSHIIGSDEAIEQAADAWNQRSASITPAEPPVMEISDMEGDPEAKVIASVRALVQGLADRYSQNLPPTP